MMKFSGINIIRALKGGLLTVLVESSLCLFGIQPQVLGLFWTAVIIYICH
jgi:hypothetical protein